MNSKIVATTSETGVTFDFPLEADGRLRDREIAWRLFEIGVVLLVGSVIWFAICVIAPWPEAKVFALVAFLAGIVLLVMAANRSWTSFSSHRTDDDLRQLAVVGNLLVRTTRDHRKQVWYRHEIDEISLEDRIETQESHGEGGSSVIAVIYHLTLTVRLRNAEKSLLVSWSGNYPLQDYRPRAELEWVTTQLRLALATASLDPANDPDEKTPLANAIQSAARYSDDTRITQ